MGTQVATIIVEPRLLVREALESLMANHSDHFVCGVGSIMDIDSSSIVPEGPKLVILGAQSADNAVTEAVSLRKLWPDSKIILLFEHASPADFQKLIASQLDGCVPLFVSPHTLISTLDLIMIRDVRVMVVGDVKRPSIPLAQREESTQPEIKTDKSQSGGGKHEAISIAMAAMQHTRPPVNGASTSDPNVSDSDTQCVPPFRNLPKLSEREAQILDGLVKGHANKVIARLCDITEATVKVHMKSILRKIQVGNRTQAAIWALEHGYPCDEIKDRALKTAAATQSAASMVEIPPAI
jgi:two-component system nitrate/nitrite response regulator NarL